MLGGGCFWCVEAVFQMLEGVHSVTSGYAGGAEATADYRSVCGGDTGHVEVIEVRFDPRVITFGQLLRIFFAIAHDPTQVDGQGGDLGTQYRSVLFYADEEQRSVAEAYVEQLETCRRVRRPDRHRDRAPGPLLRGRGVPPELRRAAPGPALHRQPGGPEGGEALPLLPRATGGDGDDQARRLAARSEAAASSRAVQGRGV